MKSKLLFFLVLAGLVASSCSFNEEITKEKEMKASHRVSTISPSFQFSLDESTQDAIVQYFAEACLNSTFFNGLLGFCDQQDSLGYVDIVFSADVTDISTDAGRLLLSETEHLSHYIFGDCDNNYLKLNVYVPNGNNTLNFYQSGQDIYIVNALYRDALSIIDEENDVYTASYKISEGLLVSCNEAVTESFANEHLTFILSFRDEIVNWHHFSKGTQSYSDVLLLNALSFVGYGCMSEDEVDQTLSLYYDSFNFFGRKWRIIYGKNIFQRPCDDHSIHFCGLEPMPVTGYSIWEDWMDSDPYRTAWMYIDLETQTQHIYITDNPLGLDLDGYDFHMQEMTFFLEEHNLIIPDQICYYDNVSNALCFDIIVD